MNVYAFRVPKQVIPIISIVAIRILIRPRKRCSRMNELRVTPANFVDALVTMAHAYKASVASIMLLFKKDGRMYKREFLNFLLDIQNVRPKYLRPKTRLHSKKGEVLKGCS